MLKKQFLLLFLWVVFALPKIAAMEKWALDNPRHAEAVNNIPQDVSHLLNDTDSVTIQLIQNSPDINHQDNPEKEKGNDQTQFPAQEGNSVEIIQESFMVPYKIIKCCKALDDFMVKTSDTTGEITFYHHNVDKFELLKRFLPLLGIIANEEFSPEEKKQRLMNWVDTTDKQEMLTFLDFANYLNCQPLYASFIAFTYHHIASLLHEQDKVKEALQTWAAYIGNTDHYYALFDFVGKNLKSKTEIETTVKSKQKFPKLCGKADWIQTTCFSLNGKYVAAGSGSGFIKIIDAATGNLFKSIENKEQVNSVCFSPDSNSIAAGLNENTIQLWDVVTGTLLKTFSGHINHVRSVGFSFDGKLIVSGSDDTTIKIWDVSSGDCIKTLQGHTEEITSVCFSSDRNLVASGSVDGTLKIWNVATEQCLKTIAHGPMVYSVCFSPDNTKVASGSNDIKIWNLITGDCIQTFNEHTESLESICFSHDGTKLVSGSWDHTIKLWDVTTGKCLTTLQEHTQPVRSVCFSPDDTKLVSGSIDSNLCIFTFYDLHKDFNLLTLLFFDYLNQKHLTPNLLEALSLDSPYYFDLYAQLPERFQEMIVDAFDKDALNLYMERYRIFTRKEC